MSISYRRVMGGLSVIGYNVIAFRFWVSDFIRWGVVTQCALGLYGWLIQPIFSILSWGAGHVEQQWVCKALQPLVYDPYPCSNFLARYLSARCTFPHRGSGSLALEVFSFVFGTADRVIGLRLVNFWILCFLMKSVALTKMCWTAINIMGHAVIVASVPDHSQWPSSLATISRAWSPVYPFLSDLLPLKAKHPDGLRTTYCVISGMSLETWSLIISSVQT